MRKKKRVNNSGITTKSKIKSQLRMMWMRSRERAAALKRDKNTCQICGKKQSRKVGEEVKVEVHHLNGIDWEEIFNVIRKELLNNVDNLITLCYDCHRKKKNENK